MRRAGGEEDNREEIEWGVMEKGQKKRQGGNGGRISEVGERDEREELE